MSTGGGVDFAGSDLTRADLTDASFKGANLTGCRLDWAWLTRTDLRCANLTHTQFVGARLINTKLYNPDRFPLGSFDRALIEDIDLSPGGDGTRLLGREGVAAIATE